MFIQVEKTPNPLTLKFLPGQSILEGTRTYDFTSISAAKISPLALCVCLFYLSTTLHIRNYRQLLRITGVKGVFFGESFVSVTKSSEDEDWSLIKPDVFAIIMDYIQTGKPIITDITSNEPTDTSSRAYNKQKTCAVLQQFSKQTTTRWR